MPPPGLSDIFAGTENSTLTCSTCKTQSVHAPSPMWIMSLEMEKCKTLQECMARYFMEEEMKAVQEDATKSNQLKCRHCREMRDGTKVLSLGTMPKVLVVHLKRFNAAGHKLCNAIAYPAQLDLDMYVAGYTEVYPIYDLYGMVVHRGGTLQVGHYSAYVKALEAKVLPLHNDQHWVHANDMLVAVCLD